MSLMISGCAGVAQQMLNILINNKLLMLCIDFESLLLVSGRQDVSVKM